MGLGKSRTGGTAHSICLRNRKAPHMANISPNRFVLQSRDGKTKVDYETTSFVGQPVLNLTQGPGGPIRHFAGSQIRTLHTEIGTLVSVTTQMTVDTGSTSFSGCRRAVGWNCVARISSMLRVADQAARSIG